MCCRTLVGTMNSTALGQVGTCGGPWEGPAPPKPGCVLINLGSPLDAAVIFLSHVPFILGLPLASLCCGSLPPPTVQEGCACPKTSYDLWDALGKHLDGAGSAGLGLCFLALEATAGTGSPSLRHRSTSLRHRGGAHSCCFPSWLFCILLIVDTQCWGPIR